MKGISALFEDENCLVISKPAGLAVQGGAGIKVSVDSILSESINPRPLLVHRLDRDTSGILVLAKNKAAAAHFSDLFNKNKIKRTYYCICRGIPNPPSGRIELDLDDEKTGRIKKSLTHYRYVRNLQFKGKADEADANVSAVQPLPEEFSLLEIELGTGRMHQIRRHLSYIGNPIIGDDKYGDFALNKTIRKNGGGKHFFLHAFNLAVPKGEIFPLALDITAPLPVCFSFFK